MGITSLGKILKASGMQIAKLNRKPLQQIGKESKTFEVMFKNGEKGLYNVERIGKDLVSTVKSVRGEVTQTLNHSESAIDVFSKAKKDYVNIPEIKVSTLVRGANREVQYIERGVRTPINQKMYSVGGKVKTKVGSTTELHTDTYFRDAKSKGDLIIRKDSRIGADGKLGEIYHRPNVNRILNSEIPLNKVVATNNGAVWLGGNESASKLNEIFGSNYTSEFDRLMTLSDGLGRIK